MGFMCDPCVYAAEHGWWGSSVNGGTHCRRCHRTWAGKTEAHCTVCCQHFTSNRVADKHDPYCTPDRTVCSERLRVATQKDGSPVFGVRERISGKVWIAHDPRLHPQVAS